MTSIKTLATVITAAIMATACNPDDGPGNFEPRLTATGASAVLHTEATLSGRIELQGSTQMPALSFLYGTDESLGLTSGLAEAVGDSVAVRVTGLKPGTTYLFCLLADNGRVELHSNTLSFTTQPSGRPAVCEATDIKHTSATLQGQADTLDNGQLPELAFLVGTESGAMGRAEGTIIDDGKATLHLDPQHHIQRYPDVRHQAQRQADNMPRNRHNPHKRNTAGAGRHARQRPAARTGVPRRNGKWGNGQGRRNNNRRRKGHLAPRRPAPPTVSACKRSTATT